jgi:hypothetical protein
MEPVNHAVAVFRMMRKAAAKMERRAAEFLACASFAFEG